MAQTEVKTLSLPLFINKKNKLLVGCLSLSFAGLLYLVTNHNIYFESHLLPFSAIDRWIPFIPQTAWVYMSEYLLFFVVYAISKDLRNLSIGMYALLVLQVISCAIFFFYPTTFPRADFPLIRENMDALTYFAFGTLRETDTPNCCAPSLHVSTCYLMSFFYLHEQREKFPFFFSWATLVAISTLTTKQHYFIDIVTGLALALLLYWVFWNKISYRESSTLTIELHPAVKGPENV